jgi:hypothetical protein
MKQYVAFERSIDPSDLGCPDNYEGETVVDITTKIMDVFDSNKFADFMYDIGDDTYEDFSLGCAIDVDDDLAEDIIEKLKELGLHDKAEILRSAISKDVGQVTFSIY